MKTVFGEKKKYFEKSHMTSFNLKKSLEYLKVQESFRSENFLQYYLYREEYIDMFFFSHLEIYPSGFYDPIICSTIEKIITSDNDNETISTNTGPHPKFNLVLQCRGVPTENLIKQLQRSNVPGSTDIVTAQKTSLPTLKLVV